MAIQSNLKNMVLVLTVTCLGCSAILGGVYAMTKAPIEAAAAEKTRQALAQVLPAFERTEAAVIIHDGRPYTYHKAYDADRYIVGIAVESTAVGFGGPLSLMVGVMPDKTVYNTSVLSHGETPGLGAKCTTDEAFMAQWKGFNPARKILAVKKDGGDVDAITASTITSRAYVEAVREAVDVVKQIMEESR